MEAIASVWRPLNEVVFPRDVGDERKRISDELTDDWWSFRRIGEAADAPAVDALKLERLFDVAIKKRSLLEKRQEMLDLQRETERRLRVAWRARLIEKPAFLRDQDPPQPGA